MKAWRPAKSLTALRNQLNLAYPNRSVASDGMIGDSSHASRPSDHNPNKAGVVTAFDITHDPKRGMDVGKLFDALIKSKDPRIKYLIYNGRIWQNGRWSKYSGTNPHIKHGHISVSATASKYDDTTKWQIKEESMPTKKNVEDYYKKYFNKKPTANQIAKYTKGGWRMLAKDLLDAKQAELRKCRASSETGKVESFRAKVVDFVKKLKP